MGEILICRTAFRIHRWTNTDFFKDRTFSYSTYYKKAENLAKDAITEYIERCYETDVKIDVHIDIVKIKKWLTTVVDTNNNDPFHLTNIEIGKGNYDQWYLTCYKGDPEEINHKNSFILM